MDYIEKMKFGKIIPKEIREAILSLEVDIQSNPKTAMFGCCIKEEPKESRSSHLVTIEFEIPRE